ncbi:hypothetical protein J556_3869 [Acinetobacter baumannii 1096934]|uniref:hypothetical protein n=1 Tax=Acinetobacter baumannii TaxID=470 RepID=UPI00044C3F72|nr:hypothetical protein [Acinetobacter baumannii]EXE01286.1 hypothetical protein J556_3869 [Acinetobacter baumannii 1096934]
MDKCREEFEKWFEETHDVIITTQFKKEGERYLDRNVRRSFETWQHQQAKVEELQRRNQMLNDNIKEQGQKLVYQNEVIETQAEKLLGLRDEKAELQKRVDAALKLIESWNEIAFDKTTHWTEGYEEGCYHCAAQLEQALKGEGQ